MCSGYALAFYDAVVSSDAALVCTMFAQFPRSYVRKMQTILQIARNYFTKPVNTFINPLSSTLLSSELKRVLNSGLDRCNLSFVK